MVIIEVVNKRFIRLEVHTSRTDTKRHRYPEKSKVQPTKETLKSMDHPDSVTRSQRSRKEIIPVLIKIGELHSFTLTFET